MVEGHTTQPARAGGYGMPARVRAWWVAAAVAGVTYGGMLTMVAVEVGPGTPLAGRIVAQPLWKMLMALLLARAASLHEMPRERRWLIGALLFCALGDLLLALPGLRISFVAGLASFLFAHLCYLRVLVTLCGACSPLRLIGVGATLGVAVGMLNWYWPGLGVLSGPVVAYVIVLSAMVCAALLARLPGPLTAWGAVAFAASDAMIGISVFVFPFNDYELAIWWSYAAAQLLITAGLLTRRAPPPRRAMPAASA
ncbi:lysoplasmalogenase [Ralstonia pseudosolanacearum]|uniref:Lysoplasmalogenase n=1 Tax=Ralstonia solanacearum TaxID=305 RepID=A0A0S4TRF5_RALSL|nr:hypothetical protein RSP799_00340 [Ralstonia solanacearum]CUV12628.1 conserved membrane protein of unknown function [Ralstonia solanacearum]